MYDVYVWVGDDFLRCDGIYYLLTISKKASEWLSVFSYNSGFRQNEISSFSQTNSSTSYVGIV